MSRPLSPHSPKPKAAARGGRCPGKSIVPEPVMVKPPPASVRPPGALADVVIDLTAAQIAAINAALSAPDGTAVADAVTFATITNAAGRGEIHVFSIPSSRARIISDALSAPSFMLPMLSGNGRMSAFPGGTTTPPSMPR